MTAHVYYHHPDDPQYFLVYVTQDKDEITTSGQDAIIENYDLDEEFFVHYTNRSTSGTVEQYDGYSVKDISLSPADVRQISEAHE